MRRYLPVVVLFLLAPFVGELLLGATPEGKKDLVGFHTGVRESAQSWRELLLDVKHRGLETAPDLDPRGPARRSNRFKLD